MTHLIETSDLIKTLDPKSVYVVDKTVYQLHQRDLSFLDVQKIYFLDHPETQKNFATIQNLIDFFIHSNLSKQDEVVAIGGGATLDLVGFAASIFKRGIRTTYVPTTLLAMIDASIGGKTAINHNQIKNLVGSFSNAEYIVYYLPFLKTLPRQEILSGFAEGYKIALIQDETLFRSLDVESLTWDQIKKCALLKLNLVEKDPFEKGIRHVLNFGHTIGHALESASQFTIPHGFAVAFGMVVELGLSYQKGFLDSDSYKFIKKRIIELYGRCPCYHSEDIKKFLLQDKKHNSQSLRIHVLSRIGAVPELINISYDDMNLAMEELWI
jgi:3-dehydroquinate synthase